MSQYDLPPQTLLQQSSARSVSGEELETFGKHASNLYSSGVCSALSEAVVQTIKTAGLSPEQVKRVVEFANTDAFLTEFKKEGEANKYVVFEGGPAEYNTVLQDLNDGGGGTVFDRGNLDYSHTPNVKTASRGGMAKTASAQSRSDDVLAEAFAVDKQAAPIPFAHPMSDVHEMRDKLATARDNITSQIGELEVDLLSISEEMYNSVKQASLSGVSLGEIVQAWQLTKATDPEMVKAAFAYMGPRLQQEVFSSWDKLGASFEKTASRNVVVNDKHPLVVTFDAYQETLTKIAHLRAAQQEILEGIEQLVHFERSVNQHYGEVVR